MNSVLSRIFGLRETRGAQMEKLRDLQPGYKIGEEEMGRVSSKGRGGGSEWMDC